MQTSEPISTSKPPLRHGEFVAIAAGVMAITALAIDIVLPTMLAIGRAYNVENENAIQWLITAYVLPYGGIQLFVGAITDRFGRKPVMLAGLIVYGFAAIASLLAPDFLTLLAMRALAGAGAAFSRIGILSMIRDRFGGRKMASVMSLVMVVFMAVPIVAPLVGQAIRYPNSGRTA